MKFTCWFYKGTSENTFCVDVENSETVAALKEAITREPDLGHIHKATFSLYELYWHPGDTNEILQQWKIQDHDPINPMCSISTLDPLKSLIIVPFMTLNCWVSSQLSFPIKISPLATASALESAIQCLEPSLHDVDLRLYKAPDVGVTEVALHRRVLK